MNDVVKEVFKFLSRKEIEKSQLVSRYWKNLIALSSDELPLRSLCVWACTYDDSYYFMRDKEPGCQVVKYPQFSVEDYHLEEIFQNCIVDRLPITFRTCAQAAQTVVNLVKILKQTNRLVVAITCTIDIVERITELEALSHLQPILELIQAKEIRISINDFCYILGHTRFFNSGANISQITTTIGFPPESVPTEQHKKQLVEFLSGSRFLKRIGISFYSKLALQKADSIDILRELIKTFQTCEKPKNFFEEIEFFLYFATGNPEFFCGFLTNLGLELIEMSNTNQRGVLNSYKFQRSDNWMMKIELSLSSQNDETGHIKFFIARKD
uniref:F-box domain-containing protein n=1 Tax=Acrobeloides nanus TaxID=290746 RepID=A0A914DQK2_9BILA